MPLLAIIALGALVVGYVLSAVVMKQKQRAATLDDFDVPQVADGTPQAVVFGDGWVDGFQVLWYGNYRTSKVKKKGQTIGFKYYMSILMGISRGPVDEIVEIEVGDKQAWAGHACSDAELRINRPNLFGGDEKEGGIVGWFSVFLGALDQVLPGRRFYLPGVKESIGGRVPDFRGVTTVWYDGQVSSLSPYLKTWSFRVRRTKKGWYRGVAWYPEKATIYLGGDQLFITTNKPNDLPVTADEEAGTVTVTFNRNIQIGDIITVGGQEITVGNGGINDDDEFKPRSSRAKSIKVIANWINANSTRFRTTVRYTDTTMVFSPLNKGSQINAMNAAHILYQCYTDPLWGRGLPEGMLDENSFIYAANTLCAEGLGLCIVWYRKEDINVFIQRVCELVGGVTYTDRETGLIVFKLIRSDYDINTLPLFTPESGLISITDEDAASSDNSYNEIIGSSLDPITNLGFQIRAQNLAARQSQGAPSSLDQDYKGIPTKGLLARIVTRDLRAMSIGLKKYNVTLDRRGWRVAPGSVFRISHPDRGIENVVVRVGEIDDGNLVNGRLNLKVAIDVFGLPATAYVDPVTDEWIAPSKVAVPAPEERLVEMGYRDLVRAIGEANTQVLPADAAFAGQVAAAPNATTMEYDLMTRAPGEPVFTSRGSGQFTGAATLADNVTALATMLPVTVLSNFDNTNAGQVLLIDDELIRLDGFADGVATVTRGVSDTIPAAHEIDAVLWTIDDDLQDEGVQRRSGDIVESQVITLTSEDRLDDEVADVLEITLAGRPSRPYPPAGVTVNGTSVYAVRPEAPEPVVAWTERNRLTQGTQIVGHVDPTVEPEAGTTYTVRVYNAKTDALLRTVADIADPTWTYTAAMAAEDGAPTRVRIELESVRDGLASYQHYSFDVALKAGWGYGWGTNWGG